MMRHSGLLSTSLATSTELPKVGHTPKTSRLVHGAGIVAMGYVMESLVGSVGAYEWANFRAELKSESKLLAESHSKHSDALHTTALLVGRSLKPLILVADLGHDHASPFVR